MRVDPADPTGTKPVADLAESWTVSKDGLLYTFKLRSGVKFHDGSVMTSKDVKASYDKIIFPPAGVGSSRKGQYRSVEVVEAPDPSTVRFRLKWPESSMLLALASPWNFIYKADILAKDIHWYEKNIMGTGPFTFVEHVKGSHWVGKKNPDYWDKGKPYLDGYRALFISSSSAQVAAIRGERAHIQFRGFSPAERDTLKAALGDIARSQGMNEIAREAGLSRSSLYKALSPDGNPEFTTVASVVSDANVTSGAASRDPGTTRQKSSPSAFNRSKRGRAVSTGPTIPKRSTKASSSACACDVSERPWSRRS